MNRAFLLTLLFCLVLCEVNGFKLPSLCKKSCSKNSDCSGSNNRCIRIGVCKKCIKFPVPPSTTKKTTTTTTTTRTTTPTTPSTPPPTPPTTCGPPPTGENVKRYTCTKGNKKGSRCFANCKANSCAFGQSSTECKCNAETCQWNRDPSGACKPKVNQCQSDEDCDAGEECSAWICGKICRKVLQPPPSTTPTTPTTCDPPPTGENVLRYTCTKGNKKGSRCFAMCKANSCPSGPSSTECKCNAETCQWNRDPSDVCKPKVDQCQSDEDCDAEEKCSAWRCGKVCRKVFTPPDCGTFNCKSNYDCPIGWSCMHDGPGFCGKCRDMSKPPPSTCLRPCGRLGKCPAGMKCVSQPCGLQCVSDSTVFTCPVPVPALGDATCGQNERACSPTLSNCAPDQVCCFSGACGKHVCKSKNIIALCKEKNARLCSTSANCLPSEICSVDEAGCQKCTKGYSCPELLGSCETVKDCKISQSCLPDKNGCLTCQGSTRLPIGPNICPQKFCQDKFCPSGQKCLEVEGCRKCVAPE